MDLLHLARDCLCLRFESRICLATFNIYYLTYVSDLITSELNGEPVYVVEYPHVGLSGIMALSKQNHLASKNGRLFKYV
jgi:hypothetical protein